MAVQGTIQARGRARRQAIIDAAVALFASKGFRGTSIAAVAKRAGVTDAGLLYHFSSKDDLLLAVLAHLEARDAEAIASLHAGFDLLVAARDFGARMEQFRDVTALGLLLASEHVADDSAANRYFRLRYAALRSSLEAAFRAAIDEGFVRRDVDVGAEASALIAHLDGIRLQWFFSDGAVSMADSVRTYVDTMLARIATGRGHRARR